MLSSSQRFSRLFWIRSNSKVCCLNLEADKISLVLQVGADMPVEIEHIIQRDEDLFLESLLALVHPNCWRHDGSIEPSIFGGDLKIQTLRRIIIEVGSYEFSYSQI